MAKRWHFQRGGETFYLLLLMLTNLRQHGSIDSFSRVTVAQCMGDKHQLTFTAYTPARDEACLMQSKTC